MHLSDATLNSLRVIDTPTVCNALGLIDPSRRTVGFNRTPLFCPFPDLPPVVGYARTAIIRCSSASRLGGAEQRKLRMGYYEHVESGPRPGIAVIQDADENERGVGAFWGEVQTNVHKALGCPAVVTDGSVRDIPQMAAGFFVLAGSIMPSHVHADVVAYNCPVTVAGLSVAPGDIIHADRHGAVIIPADAAPKIAAAAELLTRKEKVVLDACRRPGFSAAAIRAAFAEMDDIH